MNVYSALFDSMLECCDPLGTRLGILHTMAMAALGLVLCLNLLSIVDLLWIAEVLPNPYLGAGGLHPQHYVLALLYACLAINAALARLAFRAELRAAAIRADEPQLPHGAPPSVPWLQLRGSAYILGSTGLFIVTVVAGALR